MARRSWWDCSQVVHTYLITWRIARESKYNLLQQTATNLWRISCVLNSLLKEITWSFTVISLNIFPPFLPIHIYHFIPLLLPTRSFGPCINTHPRCPPWRSRTPCQPAAVHQRNSNPNFAIDHKRRRRRIVWWTLSGRNVSPHVAVCVRWMEAINVVSLPWNHPQRRWKPDNAAWCSDGELQRRWSWGKIS